MKAIVYTKSGPQLVEKKRPELNGPEDVLVRVRAASICRTDLHAAYGQIPVEEGRILGHEFTGAIEAVGTSVTSFRIGDPVVCDPFLPCGRCDECLSNYPHRCPDGGFIGLDRDGAFAEYVVVSKDSLSPLPSEISFSVGTYVEPVAAGLAIFEAPIRESDRVLVVGEGRICRLTLSLLKSAGLSKVSSVRVQELSTISDEFDVVVETAPLNGQSGAILNLLKTRGLLIIKSRNPEKLELPLLEMIRKQTRIQAVRYAPFEDAIRYAVQHGEDLAASLDATWTLQDFESAFDASIQSEESKICFSFTD